MAQVPEVGRRYKSVGGFEVERQLRASGYWDVIQKIEVTEYKVLGTVMMDVITTLNQDSRFGETPWHLLHRDIGDNLTEFRSWNGAFGKGSLQIVVDRTTGMCYCDVDRHNTQDVVNIFGHLFGEVIGPKFKRWFS